MNRSLCFVVAVMFVCLSAPVVSAQNMVTLAPDTPGVGNTFPFGAGVPPAWGPYFVFFYQNVPRFELQPGDSIAFDLGLPNNVDIEVQIDLAIHDGVPLPNTAAVGPYVTVASNTQTPINPRGNSTIGDYELEWIAEAPFSFPGGYLAVRISNPSPSYSLDGYANYNLAFGNASDTSGYFFGRAWRDADGIAPWPFFDALEICALQIRTAQSPGAVPTIGTMGLVALGILLAVAGVFTLRRVV